MEWVNHVVHHGSTNTSASFVNSGGLLISLNSPGCIIHFISACNTNDCVLYMVAGIVADVHSCW